MAGPSESQNPIHNLEREPRSEEAIVSLVDDLWDYVRGTRYQLDYNIREAACFLQGTHWIKYIPHENRFDRHTLDEWKPTPVTNYLTQHFDYLLEIFLGGDPQPVVDPASRDQDDLQAATAAQRVLRSEFERLKSGERLLPKAAGWLVLCGNAILSSNWNPHSGDLLRVPQTKLTRTYRTIDGLQCVNPNCPMYLQPIDARLAEPTCRVCSTPLQPVAMNEQDIYGEESYDLVEEPVRDDTGRPQYDEVSAGQLEEHVINPLNWYPQECSDFDEECRFVLEMEPTDLDKIQDMFGSKARAVAAESLTSESWAGRLAAAMRPTEPDRPDREDQAILRILRHIPDHRFKNGLFAIVVNGKVMHRGPIESTDGELGYTHIPFRRIPGQFWGRGPIQDLLSPQKRINSIDSHIVQNRKQMVNNRWLAPEGAGIQKVTGEAGAIIRWSPHTSGGFEPKPVQGVPLPQQVLDERGIGQQAMDEISGIGEIMRGRLPEGASGLETGAAVEFVYETAYKRFKQAIINWRGGLSQHEHRNLKILSANWDEERLVRVLGEGGDLEAYYYRGADIAGAESMAVRVGLGLKTSVVAYQRRVMEAAKAGLLGDIRRPEVRGKIVEAMEIEGFDSDFVGDARKARRVLKALRDGEEPEPILPPIDNHAIQFAILRDFILTAEYAKLPEERRQALLQRATQHQQIMQQQQQQVMQAAQAAKGTGDQVSDAVAQSGALGGEGVSTQQVGA